MYKLFIDKHDAKQEALDLLSRPALVQTNHTTPQRTVAGETNFIEAANKTVNSVVHVKNTVKSQGGVTSIFDLFYGFLQGKIFIITTALPRYLR